MWRDVRVQHRDARGCGCRKDGTEPKSSPRSQPLRGACPVPTLGAVRVWPRALCDSPLVFVPWLMEHWVLILLSPHLCAAVQPRQG